jgi:hypothetical protein
MRECVVRQLTVLLSGPLQERPPDPTTRKLHVKQTNPPVIPGTWSFFAFRPGTGEGAFYPPEGMYFLLGNILGYLGYCTGWDRVTENGNGINEESVRYVCTFVQLDLDNFQLS